MVFELLVWIRVQILTIMVLNRVWFSREWLICLFNSKWMVEKAKYPKYIIRAEFYQFLTSLNWCEGLKMGMDFRGQVWKWVWKMEYFGLKLGQDLWNRAAHPYWEFWGVPPLPPPSSRITLNGAIGLYYWSIIFKPNCPSSAFPPAPIPLPPEPWIRLWSWSVSLPRNVVEYFCNPRAQTFIWIYFEGHRSIIFRTRY